MEHDHWWIGLS